MYNFYFVIICHFLSYKTVIDVLQPVVRRPGRVESVLLYQMI